MNVSASQVRTWRRCKRLWGFSAIDKIRTPTNPAQQHGLDVHKHIEEWLRDGTVPPNTPAGLVAKQAIKHLPPPGPENRVEFKFEMPCGDATMVGYIDLLRDGTVYDHKTTSDMKYALTGDKLAADPQGIIYAKHALDSSKTARLQWTYLCGSGPLKKPKGSRAVTTVHSAATVAEPWNKIVSDVAEMIEDKKAAQAMDLPPTVTACGDYGGCYFRNKCNITPGQMLAAHMKQFNTEETEMNAKEKLAELKRKKNGHAQPPPGVVAPPQSNKERLMGRLAEIKAKKGARGVNPPEKDLPPPVEEEEVVEVIAKEPVRKSVTKIAEDKTPSTKAGKFVVMIDAAPTKGGENSKHLHELLAPILAELNGHWNEAEYGKGPALLAKALNAYLDDNPFTGVLLVDGSTAEARAVKEVLFARAHVVIRGLS